MSQYNISVVMTSHYEYITPPGIANILGIGLSSDRSKPILDVFHIDDSRYPLKDNYKVGFTGNSITNTPSRSFYVHDFMSILRAEINNDPNLCGIYQREYIGEYTAKELLKERRELAGSLVELHPLINHKASTSKILARINKVKNPFWKYFTLNQINTDVRLGDTRCAAYLLRPLITTTNDVDVESTEKKWISVADFMKVVNDHEVIQENEVVT